MTNIKKKRHAVPRNLPAHRVVLFVTQCMNRKCHSLCGNKTEAMTYGRPTRTFGTPLFFIFSALPLRYGMNEARHRCAPHECSMDARTSTTMHFVLWLLHISNGAMSKFLHRGKVPHNKRLFSAHRTSKRMQPFYLRRQHVSCTRFEQCYKKKNMVFSLQKRVHT